MDWMLAVEVIPTGEPISTIVASVIASILSLLGLFSGGISSAVRKALDGLTTALGKVAQALGQVAYTIARGVQSMFGGLQRLWSDVLKPALNSLRRIMERITRTLDRVSARIAAAVDIVRNRILQIYETYFRPVLDVISKVRQALAILKSFHVGFAERLDARLARLEAKIAAPILLALQTVNRVVDWINRIVTASGIFQFGILLNSLGTYAAYWIDLWYSAQRDPLARSKNLQLGERSKTRGAAGARADVDLYLRARTGPVAERMGQMDAILIRQRGRLGA